MSEPKRYTFEAKEILDSNGMVCSVGVATLTHPMGKFVSYEDYARLKAECQSRQAENSVLAVECDSLKAEVERLKERNQHLEQIDSYLQSANLNAEEQRSLELEAQVERLTKAGNAMAEVCGWNCNDQSAADALVEAWHKAKEGK